MTTKELAYNAQHHLQASTGAQFKRAHIYELLAATFGYNSYAALCAEAVFTKESLTSRRAADFGGHVRSRCLEIGYGSDTATKVSTALPTWMTEHRIGVVRIADLIIYLKNEWDPENEARWWTSSDEEISSIMLDGLNARAMNGDAAAHYALALIYSSDEDEFDTPGVGRDYWYMQAQNGRTLTGVEQEWADAHATCLARIERSKLNLQEAARLGHPEALLELAERYDDPAFFEQTISSVNANPFRVAEIAKYLRRPEDARKWFKEAAKRGDTNAMRRLIDDYDRKDRQQCWTWVYLAQLHGVDFTEDEHFAIHEDGSRYDDDVGGPMFVDGREGLRLKPLNTEQAAAARRIAQELYEGTQQLAK